MTLGLKPKHAAGEKIGRVLVLSVTQPRHDAPDGSKVLRRKHWWYRLQCDCGAPAYWVSQDQMRTHRECKTCARKRRIVRPEAQIKKDPPPVDFARIRLVSPEMMALMK